MNKTLALVAIFSTSIASILLIITIYIGICESKSEYCSLTSSDILSAVTTLLTGACAIVAALMTVSRIEKQIGITESYNYRKDFDIRVDDILKTLVNEKIHQFRKGHIFGLLHKRSDSHKVPELDLENIKENIVYLKTVKKQLEISIKTAEEEDHNECDKTINELNKLCNLLKLRKTPLIIPTGESIVLGNGTVLLRLNEMDYYIYLKLHSKIILDAIENSHQINKLKTSEITAEFYETIAKLSFGLKTSLNQSLFENKIYGLKD